MTELKPNSDYRLQFVLGEHATLPTRAHQGDLGFDLYASEAVSFQPGDTKLVSTGVSCKFPLGYGGFIKDRSSVAYKQQMFTHAGVIDSEYRGEIKILFYNASEFIRTFQRGDKIAQLVLVPVVHCPVDLIEEFEDETSRSTGGFGSTGK